MRNVTLQGNGKALVQMGFFMIFVGLTGWILAGGMDFILADAQTSEQISGSVPVYYVSSALLYAGGITLGFGGFIFALGLSTRDDFNRIISLLAALVSLAVMVFFILAVLSNDGRDTFISLCPELLRAAGYLVWISGLRTDEPTRSRPVAIDRA